MDPEELIRFELLKDLPDDVVAELARHCTVAERAPGQVVYDGESADLPCVFLIVEGSVEVLHADGAAGPVAVGRIGAGGVAGEFTALAGTRGRCTVRAGSATRFVVIPNDVFRTLVERHASVAVHLLRDMIGVIRGLNDRVAALKGAHSEFDRIRGQLFRFVV